MVSHPGDPAPARRIFRGSDTFEAIQRASTYLRSHTTSQMSQPDAQLIELGDSLLRLWLQCLQAAAREGSPEEAYRHAALLDLISAAIHPILHFVGDLPARTPEGHVARAAVLLAWGGFQTVFPPENDVDLAPAMEDVVEQIMLAFCIDLMTSTIDSHDARSPRLSG